MDQAPTWFWGFLGLSQLGFYLFIAVWIGMAIWARTREKLAIQETLRKLIDRGTEITPEVVDALRRTAPRSSPAEVRATSARYAYWGTFLVTLGIVITAFSFESLDSGLADLGDLNMSGVVLFVVPGLFCLAHSWITRITQPPKRD
jgi:hypothetical protein